MKNTTRHWFAEGVFPKTAPVMYGERILLERKETKKEEEEEK